jgi:hypothetical protein
MEINMTKPVKVQAKTVSLCVKCSDCFTYAIKDQDGAEIFRQDDGYVPDFMPGQHGGDYVMLEIDIDTGVITNWMKPTAQEIETIINKKED